MARKPKKKVARKKVVSQPRKTGSRPVWALLFFFIAICSFVAIWDFEITQSRQHTTDPEMNLVGVFGAEMSFWAFYFIGVATWLAPLYLLWAGVRFLLQQRPRRRLLSALATLASLVCASGLAAMLESIEKVKMQGGIFEHQLSQGVGGVCGEFFATVVLQPFIGPFGAFLILVTGFVVGSIIVFTDNLGRFLDYIQNAYAAFLAGQAASKEERKALKAERAEAKRLAKEEAAAAKAQLKADRAAAKAAKQQKSSEKGDEGDEDVE
jgi:F0F1-type ATP synthase membrane subunit b/b'